MELTQTNLLFLYSLVVILVLLSFLGIRRGSKPPVKLDLRDQPANSSVQKQPSKNPATARQIQNQTVPVTRSRSERSGDQKAVGDETARKRPPGWDNYRPRPRTNWQLEDDPVPTQSSSRQSGSDSRSGPDAPLQEKVLNVLYNWNGHSWDAYEVLGLPAGSSVEAASEALQRALGKTDPESHAFLKAAFDAITRKT